MSWLSALCILLSLVILTFLIKMILLYRALNEIDREFSAKLDTDTNTIISVSSGDRRIRRFAASLNCELRRLRHERLRFQSGNQELKEAITNIAHDLRTPLTAILGYLELLEKEEKSETVAHYTAVIHNRADALKQLTEELFQYSVIVANEKEILLEELCLNDVLEESIAAYYDVLQTRGITPKITIPETQVMRCLNRASLSRIFANILSNALKYSDGDLEITLFDTGEIVFSNTASNLDFVQVEKLFQRFYTLETARNSTGLGLTIAQILVEQMGGEIRAQYEDAKLWIFLLFSESNN